MDVLIGPTTEMTEDRSDQGPKWLHTLNDIHTEYVLLTQPVIAAYYLLHSFVVVISFTKITRYFFPK